MHLRPSGNAPELRLYTEAETEQAARDLLLALRNLLDQDLETPRTGKSVTKPV